MAGRARPGRDAAHSRAFREPDIFMTGIWFSGHNNVRYASLIPRLARLDPQFVQIRGPRLVRSAQYRLLGPYQQSLIGALNRRAQERYDYTLVTDYRQLANVTMTAVVDVDDPNYTAEEVHLLNSPKVACVVVPIEAARDKYLSMGVRNRIEVVAHGHNAEFVSARSHREHQSRGLVFGFAAPFLLSGEGTDPMYNVDELVFDWWPRIHSKCANARLALVGKPGRRLQRKVEDSQGVLLLGTLSASEVRAFHAQIDIGIYPRRIDHVRSSLKVVEMVASGTPIVGFDVPPTVPVRESGCGSIVDDVDELIHECIRIGTNHSLRSNMAEGGLRWGRGCTWDAIATEYADLLDEVLPRHA